MDNIDKLRMLVWDKEEEMFSDPELEEILSDSDDDVYRAAVMVLNIIMANPKRIEQYSRGGVSITKSDISRAINDYSKVAGDSYIQTASIKSNYPGTVSKKGRVDSEREMGKRYYK